IRGAGGAGSSGHSAFLARGRQNFLARPHPGCVVFSPHPSGALVQPLHAMVTPLLVQNVVGTAPQGSTPPGNPCVLVIFGASGDLTKRLLMPAIYNLACDGLLPKQFALVGVGRSELSAEKFREKMTEDIKTFSTRTKFDEGVWQDL